MTVPTVTPSTDGAPEDRPAQCPNCGSTDPRKVGIRPASPLTGDGAYSAAFSEVCSDPWHAPAGVPALDDDTRREIEVLIVDEVQDSPTATPTSLPMVADLAQERGEHAAAAMVRAAVKHLAAYLGGTDGRER